ncbi:MAG TPA: M20/M25/M40 family metallo-hydrolase [Terriglobales bacterium]|nr:M20/M25/M40 family metallo-hydrolase [Terriglobales bacterium]
MLKRLHCLIGLIILLLCGAAGQNAPQAAREWTAAHRQQILDQFASLLAIPNVASDAANIRRNAETLLGMLKQRGVDARLLSIPEANPVVYGEIRVPNAKHTIVFYAHYDGQPVTPSDWVGADPFKPEFRIENGETRIYARSASDDKAAILAQLTALDALQAARIPPKSNIRFVWEGEEEAGSPHLEQILEANRNKISGDVWLICDGPVDQSGAQSVVFGARGDTHLEINVYGPRRELHSGHYGNWAPNPAMMLVHLLAGMKDDSGHILIPHFYDGITPLSQLEEEAIARAPRNDAKLKQELWLGHVDGGGRPLLELLNYPTLNINGIASGRTGARANNVIPAMATVDLDLRLVVGLDWRQQQNRVIDYVRSQGYYVTEREPDAQTLLAHAKVAFVKPDSGYNAVRTPMDLPMAKEVIEAVETAHNPVILWPTMGGSVPLGAIERAASTHTVTVPIANYDNNQHSANENIRLQNLWDGIETMAALMAMQ